MKPILRISILLNLTLAVAAVLVIRKPAKVDGNPSGAEPVASTKPATELPLENLAASNATVVFTTNAFHWQQLESTNYDTFVVNLRAIGCPDRTIRDLVFADAERRYAELQSAEGETIPFWLAGRALVEANRRNETNRTAAQEELRAELRRLFGVDWSPEEHEVRDIKFQVMSRLIAGPVSDEQHEQAWRWLMATIEKGQTFRQRRQHLLLDQDHVAWQTIAQNRKTLLEGIFSTSEYEEFQARTTFLEEMLGARLIHLEDLELTPVELRRVCLAKIREVGWLDDLFRMDRSKSKDDKEAQKVAFAAALRHELSPQGFEEFVRVQDDDYRNILEVTRGNELPRSAAQKVYEVRQLAETEFKRLQAEADSAEAAAALAALQITTGDSIRKILGPEVFNKFTARNGQWATNLFKL